MTTSSHFPPSATRESAFAIDRLIGQRAQIKDQIRSSEDKMSSQWLKLFAPPAESGGAGQWVARFERGYAIADGIMTGYKLLRRLRVATDLIARFRRGRGKRK